jgi:hypothetical protein
MDSWITVELLTFWSHHKSNLDLVSHGNDAYKIWEINLIKLLLCGNTLSWPTPKQLNTRLFMHHLNFKILFCISKSYLWHYIATKSIKYAIYISKGSIASKFTCFAYYYWHEQFKFLNIKK